MKKQSVTKKLKKYVLFIYRQFQYIYFKVRYPKVLFINPSRIGRYYSQDGQDVYVSSILFNLLQCNDNKIIIDIGCNHPTKFSNSYFFEKYFNCNVFAIDPLTKFSEQWKIIRPTAIFIPTAVGKDIGHLTLNIPIHDSTYDDMFSTVVGYNPKVGKVNWESYKVPCTTLNQIVGEQKITEVLILSIDVEGAEMDVLQGINFEKTLIKCIIIENNAKNLFGSDDIRKFLKSKSFDFMSRIGYLDDIYINKKIKSKL